MELAKEYVINDPEDLLECPYESSHMIRARRMPPHIVKCRLHHGSSDMARCPYNASHEVYAVELRYHMAVCEDKQRVQGKIIQEHFDKDREVKGCIETPGYKPLQVWGDSWENEAPAETAYGRGRLHPPEITPKEEEEEVEEEEEEKDEVVLTAADKHGLSGRQVRELYLWKKNEMERSKLLAAAELRTPGPEERLRVPRQASQSLALHQQQHQQHDIYQQALQGQQNRVIAMGRGRGLLLGPTPLASVGGVAPGTGPSPSSPRLSPGAGRGIVGRGPPGLVNNNTASSTYNSAGGFDSDGLGYNSNSGGGGGYNNSEGGGGVRGGVGEGGGKTVTMPAGRGMGDVLRGGSLGQSQHQHHHLTHTTNNNNAVVAGRGIGHFDLASGGGGGRGVGAGGVFDIGIGRGGRGAATFDDAGGMSGIGRGAPLDTVGRGGGGVVGGHPPGFHGNTGVAGGLGEQEFPPLTGSSSGTSASEGEGEGVSYAKAMSWVGGGYGDNNRADCGLSASSSATSMASNSVMPVGSWADEVERRFPLEAPQPPASVHTSDSALSSDSDFQDCVAPVTAEDARKELRRTKKKLRQVDELEAKRMAGLALDQESVFTNAKMIMFMPDEDNQASRETSPHSPGSATPAVARSAVIFPV